MTKRNSRNTHLIIRGEEAGGITKADIERRARELALIRTGSEAYSEEDLLLAQRELFGEDTPAATTEDDEANVFITRDPAEPRGIPGQQRKEIAPEEGEENDDPERLAIQGVEEAQHDQMVESRRSDQDETREDEESERRGRK
jgi:hypothetical protein